jgi:hypothetical protein
MQRKVRTIGEVDAEVRLGKQTLIEDTGLGADKSFEESTELDPSEREVLIGHGNENAIGGYDAAKVTAAMTQKIKPDRTYNVIFFACKTGSTPRQPGTEAEPPRALSAKVQSALKASGFKVTITAPKGILLVLGNKRYLVAEKFPDIGRYPSRKTARDARDLVKRSLESLAALNEAEQDPKAWERDVRTQQRRGWIKKVQPTAGNAWCDYFKKNVQLKLNDIAALDLGIPADDAVTRDKRTQAKARTKTFETLEKTLAVIRELEASAKVKMVTAAEFKSLAADADQPAIAKRLNKVVGEGRPDQGETMTRDLDQLGPAWQRDE